MSNGEQPARHGPAERLGQSLVAVGDERLDPLPEMRLGAEVAAAKQLVHQDGEADLDLIDPGRVPRREVEGDAVADRTLQGLPQRACRARLHRIRRTRVVVVSAAVGRSAGNLVPALAGRG